MPEKKAHLVSRESSQFDHTPRTQDVRGVGFFDLDEVHKLVPLAQEGHLVNAKGHNPGIMENAGYQNPCKGKTAGALNFS